MLQSFLFKKEIFTYLKLEEKKHLNVTLALTLVEKSK